MQRYPRTGATHHAQQPIGALVIRICSQPPEPIRARRPSLSQEVAVIVHRALALEPQQRFQSAHDMQCAIAALLLEWAPLAALRLAAGVSLFVTGHGIVAQKAVFPATSVAVGGVAMSAERGPCTWTQAVPVTAGWTHSPSVLQAAVAAPRRRSAEMPAAQRPYWFHPAMSAQRERVARLDSP